MKLLVHSSACYSPTLIQSSQSRLFHIMASEIRHNGFFPVPNRFARMDNTDLPLNIFKAPVKLDQDIAKKRLDKRKLQRITWSKKNKKGSFKTTALYKYI